MSILKIAKIGHPVLIKKSEKVKNISKDDLKRLVIDMTHTLLDAEGIGLAAPQVHIGKRIIIFRTPVKNDEDIEEKKIQITKFLTI